MIYHPGPAMQGWLRSVGRNEHVVALTDAQEAMLPALIKQTARWTHCDEREKVDWAHWTALTHCDTNPAPLVVEPPESLHHVSMDELLTVLRNHDPSWWEDRRVQWFLFCWALLTPLLLFIEVLLVGKR